MAGVTLESAAFWSHNYPYEVYWNSRPPHDAIKDVSVKAFYNTGHILRKMKHDLVGACKLVAALDYLVLSEKVVSVRDKGLNPDPFELSHHSSDGTGVFQPTFSWMWPGVFFLYHIGDVPEKVDQTSCIWRGRCIKVPVPCLVQFVGTKGEHDSYRLRIDVKDVKRYVLGLRT